MDALPAEADGTRDPELVRLVTTYTWHAVPQAIAWVDATDPGARPANKQLPATTLRARARLTAAVMTRERKAPALEAIIDRVATWTAEDWKAYGGARKLEAEAVALYNKVTVHGH